MSAINSFAKSGMWEFKNIIAPVAATLPLVVEGTLLAKNIVQKPGYLKAKFIEAKNKIIDSFTRREGENTPDAVKRIAKNVFIVLACMALMAGAAYASIHLLPAALGITAAISAIFLIGKLFINASSYKQKIIEAFTVKPGEDPEVAKKRIRMNIIKTVVIGIITAIAIGTGLYIIIPLLQNFTWQISLPFQTRGVVLAEYLSMAVLHVGLAIYKFLKGNKAEALFHLAAASAAIAFPIFYWGNEMRLHHSFYGLALMALPSRTAKMMGSMIVFDSWLYTLAPLRGGMDAGGFVQYDFINVIGDNLGLFAGGIAGAAILENINDNWAAHEEKLNPISSKTKLVI
jgi:hypothetical protein